MPASRDALVGPDVDMGLPLGAAVVAAGQDINAIKVRLRHLHDSCEGDGYFTRAITADWALQAIEFLQRRLMK